jgi:streptogramin lyase
MRVVKLTPSARRCSGHAGRLVCTITVNLAAGEYRATFKTYDEAPIGGAIPVGAKLLSTARNVTFKILRDATNQIGLTVAGVPTSVFVCCFPDGNVGTAFGPTSFVVTPKDADGNIIVGTYAAPITLSDSDSSGATTIVTVGNDHPPAGELLSSSDLATISYTGAAIAPVTIYASDGTVTGSGVFAVHPRELVYVSNDLAPLDPLGGSGRGVVLQIQPGCPTGQCVTTVGPNFNTPTGVAVDRSGNLFASTYGGIEQFAPGCVVQSCVTLNTATLYPVTIAVDNSDNIFFTDTYGSVEKLPTGCNNSGCATILGGGFNFPLGLAVDDSGNVFVADEDNNAVKEIPPGCILSAACVTTLGGGFSFPRGVAYGLGNVFVADWNNNAVKEIPSGCATAACVLTLGGGFASPYGVAVDGSGNVFVTDNTALKEIPPGCVAADCVITITTYSWLGAPPGVAIAP